MALSATLDISTTGELKLANESKFDYHHSVVGVLSKKLFSLNLPSQFLTKGLGENVSNYWTLQSCPKFEDFNTQVPDTLYWTGQYCLFKAQAKLL